MLTTRQRPGSLPRTTTAVEEGTMSEDPRGTRANWPAVLSVVGNHACGPEYERVVPISDTDDVCAAICIKCSTILALARVQDFGIVDDKAETARRRDLRKYLGLEVHRIQRIWQRLSRTQWREVAVSELDVSERYGPARTGRELFASDPRPGSTRLVRVRRSGLGRRFSRVEHKVRLRAVK